MLRITSLLSILLMTLHVTDDIVRGISPAGPENIFGVVIFVVWSFGALVLTRRRSGYVIMLLGGLFAAAMPVAHMQGKSYATIAGSGDGFFFVWTLFTVGVTGTLAVIFSALALWQARRGQPQPDRPSE